MTNDQVLRQTLIDTKRLMPAGKRTWQRPTLPIDIGGQFDAACEIYFNGGDGGLRVVSDAQLVGVIARDATHPLVRQFLEHLIGLDEMGVAAVRESYGARCRVWRIFFSGAPAPDANLDLEEVSQ